MFGPTNTSFTTVREHVTRSKCRKADNDRIACITDQFIHEVIYRSVLEYSIIYEAKYEVDALISLTIALRETPVRAMIGGLQSCTQEDCIALSRAICNSDL